MAVESLKNFKMDSSDSFINGHRSHGADVAQVGEESPSKGEVAAGAKAGGTLQSRHFHEGMKCARERMTDCSARALNDQADKNITHKCKKFTFCSRQIFLIRLLSPL